MVHKSEFGSFRHLVARFFGALWPKGPSYADETWARGWLVTGEEELWVKLSGADRRHAVGVARQTISLLGRDEDSVPREIVAAALLHDVGKLDARLGTIARALLTGVALLVGRARLVAEPKSTKRESDLRKRVRLYFSHDRVGAELLERAGSHPVTVAWTREHHLAPARWTVERRFAEALKAADGD